MCEKEICNECGKSVKQDSGNFINRVPSGNTIEERRRMNKPHPKGGFICRDCSES